jgi:hypothetical protein
VVEDDRAFSRLSRQIGQGPPAGCRGRVGFASD